MASNMRKNHDTALKARVALEALKEERTAEGSSDFIIIVSGLPRSGTSMMMRILEAGGIEIITDGAREPD